MNNATTWTDTDHQPNEQYIVRYRQAGTQDLTCTNTTNNGGGEDGDLAVPVLYATSDGTEAQVSWSTIPGFDLAGVEVFRNGVSLGVTTTGSITTSAADAEFTARTIGGDGNHSVLSAPLNFVSQEAGSCVAVALTDGTTAITWVDAPDGDVTILDRVEDRYIPLEWAERSDSGIAYFVDSHTPQAGQPDPDYRVTLAQPDGSLSSQACDGRNFDASEFERLDAMNFPVTAAGEIGRDVPTGQVPQRVTYEDPPVANRGGSTPEEAKPACSAGGIFSDAGNAPDLQWITLSVPAGVTVTFDLILRQEETGGGAWITELNAYNVNDDGSPGARVGRRFNTSGPFYWGRTDGLGSPKGEDVYLADDRELFTAPTTSTYLLKGGVNWSQADAEDDPSSRFEDIKFWRDGELIAEPCALTDVFRCKSNGGDFYNDTGQDITTREGQILEAGGCYDVDTCASTSFPVVLDQVARWACRNDPFLEAAQDAAVAVAIVAGVIIAAPVSAGVVLGGAGVGLAMTPWTCDQTDNGWWKPSLDLDSSCIATETALGAIFAPFGAAGLSGTVTRAAAVGCAVGAAEGATSTAVYGYTSPERNIDPTNTTIAAALGCATVGTIEGSITRITRNADGAIPPVPCTSFPAGTLVRMGDGSLDPIETLEIGDEVLSFDTSDLTFTVETVTNHWSHPDDALTTLDLVTGASITSTPRHPFYDPMTGSWVEARHLDPGDQVFGPNGTYAITGTTTARGNVDVWDITVDNTNTFIVSASGTDIVVHNAQRECPLGTSDHAVSLWETTSNPTKYPARSANAQAAAAVRNVVGKRSMPVHHLLPKAMWIPSATSRKYPHAGATLDIISDRVDDAENLMALPANAEVLGEARNIRPDYFDDLADSAIHPGTHTDAYKEEVQQMLIANVADRMSARGIDTSGFIAPDGSMIPGPESLASYNEALEQMNDILGKTGLESELLEIAHRTGDEIFERLRTGDLQTQKP